MRLLNHRIQATPVYAFLFIFARLPSAPDPGRWAEAL